MAGRGGTPGSFPAGNYCRDVQIPIARHEMITLNRE